ncbi:ABC transporter permease [candidate division KSB1 bacterium]|nr:ABC transporter permease [candidate division KSB1 bacterium]NIR70855.1 ABC transporter permease [candidate division KSB1 bacterium]NIS24641.1 ABC transporter permease [candidate division KSB1 bacterium]NIT71543.1 ABC transporter permease [candidate division KSB1 bacterium]NIU25241.1 ABC transporter permease [candidate division KSB1 bacterium]
MFKNYLKITLRNMLKNKVYSVINIFGLALGMACSMLIFMYIAHELSYDRYHSNADRIYRVTQKSDVPNGYNLHFARCSVNWINQLPKEYPEIETLIRFQRSRITDIKIGENKFRDRHTFKTDANVFDVFDFELIQGEPRNALSEPYSVVLTESITQKYFGEENPIGQEITFVGDTVGSAEKYKITGVLRDLPPNSHFKINFLKSFKSPEERTGWAYIYILLKPNTNAKILESKFRAFIEKHVDAEIADYAFLPLQRLTDIHLHSDLAREIEPNGNILYIYIFASVAVFIILIACINFMNLATARSLDRAREIGIRKVLGSDRTQLIGYFFCESFVFALIAFCLAIGFVELFLSDFSNLVGQSLRLNSGILIGFSIIALITGLVAGSYPAMVMSSFRPVSVLRGKLATTSGSRREFSLRKALVVLQFVLSIGLIVSAFITHQQFRYIQNKNLGLNTEQTVVIPRIPDAIKENYFAFKNEITAFPGVAGVSASMEEPSREIRDTAPIYAEGMQEGEDTIVMDILPVDLNFFDFMDIEIVAGKTFPPSLMRTTPSPSQEQQDVVNFINEQNRYYILNETAIKAIGWTKPEDALDKKFSWGNSMFNLQRGPVIGVVRDFHFTSLRNKIEPVVMVYEPIWLSTIMIKVHPENIAATLDHVEQKWNEFYPDYPFEYTFVDKLFEQLYVSEQKQTRVLGLFSGVAIFVALMGIFGLAAYTAEQRTKEIGIRKVLGATVTGIVGLLSKDFVKLVLIANVIAWPIAWYAMNRWLQNFAYRTDIDWFVFALAGGLALIIALATVSSQAIKAAVANPVDALRYE